MASLQALCNEFDSHASSDLTQQQLERLRKGLKNVDEAEVASRQEGEAFLALLQKFRVAVADIAKLNGDNYAQLLGSILAVGEDGLYSNSLRFLFELIQNVDDCEYDNVNDCKLSVFFDIKEGTIVLRYNEKGFTPKNVFAITGIAEAAKNIVSGKTEIGEKGIGFKSVFGVADRVLIRSGWFSFELNKESFTIPVPHYLGDDYCAGTEMTLFVGPQTESIFNKVKQQYCQKTALFSKNPLLFLNKLTSLRLYLDSWRSMEFAVTRGKTPSGKSITREDDVEVSVKLCDTTMGTVAESIKCMRYSLPVVYNHEECKSRYGSQTELGSKGGKPMLLQAVVPCKEYVDIVGKGALYSFLPTQLAFTVPIVCHAPFKLDASREFVHAQAGNLWFQKTVAKLGVLFQFLYLDLRTIVKENIVRYLPQLHESIIAKNNGKEECLSKENMFSGKHILELPLIPVPVGGYRRTGEVFVFAIEEQVTEQELVCKLLGLKNSLFVPPIGAHISGLGIKVESNVLQRVFQQAFKDAEQAETCIEYLERAGYEYSEKALPKTDSYYLKAKQVEVFLKNEKLARIMHRITNAEVKAGKRPPIHITDWKKTLISYVLNKGFKVSETPKCVEKYLSNGGYNCMQLNIPREHYLAVYEGMVLPMTSPEAAFASFCLEIDPSDTYAIRSKLREASEKLNHLVESNEGTAEEFLRQLMNVRLTVKDSLGDKGYKSYLDLILKSGSDRTRFIQELLQNADDCHYPEGEKPYFVLTSGGGKIVTQYNELGFTRRNIRAITAIGESTKDKLLKNEAHAIGEKGIGFKSIFASAKVVRIDSGEYHFSLSANEPTVPREEKSATKPTKGTRMELSLRPECTLPKITEKEILELCLCLRKLKRIEINGHKVTIADTDTQRILTVDKKSYTFSRYTRPFKVTNKTAIQQLKKLPEDTEVVQNIVCYVPEKAPQTDFLLYVGLPTKHKVHIPMAIDAPFELTTSREQIDIGCSAWNDIVCEELYRAIIDVMHARKVTDRANVLRFVSSRRQMAGNQTAKYVNYFSDCDYLNAYDFLSQLRKERILPTFNSAYFTSVNDKKIWRYPAAITMLMGEKDGQENPGFLQPEMVIDTNVGNLSKEAREKIESSLNALGCEEGSYELAFPLIEKKAEDEIGDDSYRGELYDYLQGIPVALKERLQKLAIIPVYGTNGGTEFICWTPDIFVKKNERMSAADYWVLNESYLPKFMCEKMMGENINEMSDSFEATRYCEKLAGILRGNDMDSIYAFLLSEYKKGYITKYHAKGTLLEAKGYVPLKNAMGMITDTNLFVCKDYEYFTTAAILGIMVHRECEALARFLDFRELNRVHYEDFEYNAELTQNEVEEIMSGYFQNGHEILRGYYSDGLLSQELIEKNQLGFLAFGGSGNDSVEYDFPTQKVGDKSKLKEHVSKLWKNPTEIVVVEELVSVRKWKRGNALSAADTDESRRATMDRYRPEGVKEKCFCQSCKRVRNTPHIRVDCLDFLPEYYFPQLRVALCLECSVNFELLRRNDKIRERYIDQIRNYQILSNDEAVCIQVEDEFSLTFTAKHLAEIQEILKQMPQTKTAKKGKA